jgi:hypothetical protein
MFLPTPYLKRHEVYDFEIFVHTLMGGRFVDWTWEDGMGCKGHIDR